MPSIKAPSYEERLIIVGANGSGKSRLTNLLQRVGNYRRTFWLDLKGDVVPEVEHSVVKDPSEWAFTHARNVVFRPAPGSYWRTDRGIAEVLTRVLSASSRAFDSKRKRSRAPILVIIPEILLLGPLAQRVVAEMASGARALELGLWVETQRPLRIPVVTRSEAWRWYIFPLGYEDDERHILKYAKGALTLEQLRAGDEHTRATGERWFYELLLRKPDGTRTLELRYLAPLPNPNV